MQNFASKRSICPVIAAAFLTLSNVSAANAQALDFVRNLFNRDKADEDKTVEAVVEEETATNCPESVRHFSAAQHYPMSCGRFRPPERDPSIDAMEGVWEVIIQDEKDPQHWYAALSKGLNGVSHRDPNGAWTLIGMFRTYAATPDRVSTDGVETIFFDGSGDYRMRVSRGAAANVMQGRWTNGEKSALAIWRKKPPAQIRSITFNSNYKKANGADVSNTVLFGARPGRFEFQDPLGCGYGHMRGNCHLIYITIAGQNLAGPHEIWLDPLSHMELLETRFLYSGDSFPTAAAMKWIVTGEPVVEAIQLQFAVWDGVKSGSYNLWFDGQPIPFYFHIENDPDENDKQQPNLIMLQALSNGRERVSQIEEGAPFRLVAHYDGDYPDPWAAVEAPGLPKIDAGGRLAPQTIILQRTDNPRILQSRLLKVEKAEFYGVVDEPLGEEEGAEP